MNFRVGVVGASGYTGAELLRLIDGHPSLEVAFATSREFEGQPVASVYRNLTTTLSYSAMDMAAMRDVDLVFLALPHGASMEVGTALVDQGVRVVDLSADFRLHDPEAYPTWFGRAHIAPDRLSGWVYGLPEIHRDAIAGARAVANPGCYPTATILALAPLLRAGRIDPTSVVVSAASGVSGAGRSATPGVHFSHVHGSIKAYGVPTHKHTPEIEQELSAIATVDVRLTFVPHLVPMSRGLLATCIAETAAPGDPLEDARTFYAGERFVRVDATPPETGFTAGSNAVHVGYATDERAGRTIAFGAIDNLGKGAAGQALQNANLMLGLPEDAGLDAAGVYP